LHTQNARFFSGSEPIDSIEPISETQYGHHTDPKDAPTPQLPYYHPQEQHLGYPQQHQPSYPSPVPHQPSYPSPVPHRPAYPSAVYPPPLQHQSAYLTPTQHHHSAYPLPAQHQLSAYSQPAPPYPPAVQQHQPAYPPAGQYQLAYPQEQAAYWSEEAAQDGPQGRQISDLADHTTYKPFAYEPPPLPPLTGMHTVDRTIEDIHIAFIEGDPQSFEQALSGPSS
jgi:hypothetical protein